VPLQRWRIRADRATHGPLRISPRFHWVLSAGRKDRLTSKTNSLRRRDRCCDTPTSECVTIHPGLFTLSGFRHDVSKETWIVTKNPEGEYPRDGVLMQSVKIAFIDDENFFRSYLKRDWLKFPWIWLVKKRQDTVIYHKVGFLDLDTA